MHRGKAARDAMKHRSQALMESDEEDLLETNYPSQTPKRVGSQTDLTHTFRDPILDDNYDMGARTPGPPRTPGRNTYSYQQDPIDYPRRTVLSDDDLLMDDVRPPYTTPRRRPSSSLPLDFRHDTGDMMPSRQSSSLNDMYKRIKHLEQIQQDYDALVNLRFTEAEEIHKRYVAARSQQLSAADSYVKKMEEIVADKDKEIEQLKEQLQNAKSDPAQAKEMQRLIMQNERLSSELALHKQPDNDSSKNLTQMKYMFEELTGLLISDVKSTPEGESYNCVQTGKHGTIQFKLVRSAVSPDELRYIPLLDRKRDAELITKLPEYLVNEILFSKDKANIFHLRLRNALNQ